MYQTQFQYYQSIDAGAPVIYGVTGSLIAVLDACLVNGYGTKAGAGWLKPFANVVNGAGLNEYAGYTQPSGSGLSVFINDNNPNGSSFKEAIATGWEILVNPSSSVSNTVGSGSGQFPLPAQSLTTGHVTIRKSTTNDSSSVRPWVVYADSSSFYAFIQTGDTANVYYGFGFGDIFSFQNVNNTGTNDAFKCIIMGRFADNSSAAASDGFDFVSNANGYATQISGNYMPRSYIGTGTSIAIARHGDGNMGNANFYLGVVPMPNPTDSGLYISPVWVVETATSALRGQLRGLYQPLHPIANFADGQGFSGSIDFGGKTFRTVKTTPNSGLYVLETSNTVQTN
jgi:hypothetical protein